MSFDYRIEVTCASQKKVLRILLTLNTLMLVQSTGLLADSLDMLTDALVYSLALYAVGRSTSIKSKAAIFSGGCQVVIPIGIFSDIIRRVIYGPDPCVL